MKTKPATKGKAEAVTIGADLVSVMKAVDAIGPTTNALIRDRIHGSSMADKADPAGRACTTALGKLQAMGLVELAGNPRRWKSTGKPWRV